MIFIFFIIASLIKGGEAICSGLDEQSCLKSSANECCVWCGKDNGDGKCVSMPYNSAQTTNTCDVALTQLCGLDYSASACFCCNDCATNAVGVFHNRALALTTTLIAGLAALFAPRSVWFVVIVAFFAGLNGAEAMSMNDVWVIIGGQQQQQQQQPSSSNVGLLPHYVYVPQHQHLDFKRASPSPIVIQRMNVSAFVTENYAKTIVENTQKNAGDVAALATFQMNIPETAFVSGMSILVGGKYYIGKVVRKEVAQQMFDQAVMQGQTAALLSSRGTSAFAVSMNTAAGTLAVFTVTYEELLQRKLGSYFYKLNLTPGTVVPTLSVTIDIYHSSGLTDIAWSHDKLAGGVASTEVSDMKRRVLLSYSPTQQLQQAQGVNGLAEDIDVQYNVVSKASSGQVVFSRAGDVGSRNGNSVLPALLAPTTTIDSTKVYFVHQFAAPDWLTPSVLSLVFVLDRSGSMGVTKMTQAITALKNILGSMRATDRVGMVVFDDQIEQYPIVDCTPSNVQNYQSIAGRVNSRGSTNISGALKAAIDMLKGRTTSASNLDTPTVVLLTDGEPTAGIQDAVALRKYIRQEIGNNGIPVQALGFGFSLNFELLLGLAADTDAVARRIYEDGDAVSQLTGFFDEIASPLLSSVVVTYESNAVVDSVSRSTFPTLFKGSEFVVAGVLKSATAETYLNARITARSCGCQVAWSRKFVVDTTTSSLVNAEKIWAFVTIKQLLSKARTDALGLADGGVGVVLQDLAKEKSIQLALQYGFVTEYTSLITIAVDDNTPTTSQKLSTLAATPSNAINTAAPQTYARGGATTYIGGALTTQRFDSNALATQASDSKYYGATSAYGGYYNYPMMDQSNRIAHGGAGASSIFISSLVVLLCCSLVSLMY